MWSLSIQQLQVKHENTYKHTMYVQIYDTHMYTHIHKNRARNSFITMPFLFNVQNKSFHDRDISLVNKVWL